VQGSLSRARQRSALPAQTARGGRSEARPGVAAGFRTRSGISNPHPGGSTLQGYPPALTRLRRPVCSVDALALSRPSRAVDMPKVPRLAGVDQLSTASASDHARLDHGSNPSPSSAVSWNHSQAVRVRVHDLARFALMSPALSLWRGSPVIRTARGANPLVFIRVAVGRPNRGPASRPGSVEKLT
jgi:hypothetical protein